MHCCEVKPLPEPSSNAEVTSGSTSLVCPKLSRTFHRKRGELYVAPEDQSPGAAICPREVPAPSRYNPERDGAGAIRGGCRYCLAMYELYAGKLAVERSLQALEQQIERCAVFNVAAP